MHDITFISSKKKSQTFVHGRKKKQTTSKYDKHVLNPAQKKPYNKPLR